MTGEELAEPAFPLAEQFTLSVVAADVLEADRLLWEKLEQYLGLDPAAAWVRADVGHGEELDEEGRPTGRIVSTAVFRRDMSQASPTVVLDSGVQVPAPDAELPEVPADEEA